MRGAHTCGALMGLHDLGRDHFDVVAASSAGALTVSYFVAGQISLFPSVWVDYLHDGTFINLKNAFKKGHHVMDMDYLVDSIFGEQVPLDKAAIQKSSTDFFVTTTDCLTGRPVYLDIKTVDIPLALKATAAMPFVYRTPLYINNRRVVDGGISDSIPIRKAIDENCDEIILLSTRPKGYRKKPMLFQFWIRLLFREYPHLCWALKNRYRIYNETVEWIAKLEKQGKVRVIQPEKTLPVSRLSSNQDGLKRAVEIGFNDVRRVLGKA